MIAFFLFFFYLAAGIFFLHLIIRRKVYPFTIYHTAAIMLFKVFMGCLYGWIFLRYYGGDDTWYYFLKSKDETSLLIHHPLLFLKEFSPAYALEATNYQAWPSFVFYVAHFEEVFMVKGLAVLNLLSGKNYYINVLIFEFLVISGPLLLFKLLARIFPGRTGINFLLIFFIPSVTFWCSGIRAESLLLFFLAVMIYNGYNYAQKRSLWSFWTLLAGTVGLLLIRYQFLLVFLPAFIAFWISTRNKVNSPVYFERIFILGTLLFFLSLFLPPDYQLSRPLVKTQENFFSLQANTRYGLDTLKPGPVSFIKIFPQAFANSSLRPSPWEGKHGLQSVSAIEVLFLIVGLIYFILGPKPRSQVSHPVYWLFLFYALSQLLLIGYTVPFPGAIVRYRSIPFLFLALFLYAGNPLYQQKLRYWLFRLH